MAAPTICALLFVIGVLVTPVRLQSDPCDKTNPTTTGVPFNLTVAPITYLTNASYTVTVAGVTNFTTVLLQAVDSNTAMTLGIWSGVSGAISCNNSFLSNSSSMSFTATWTSPGTTESVEIRAYIKEGNTLYMTKQALLRVSSTAAPQSSNTTGSLNITTFTNAPGSNQTATSPSTGNSTSSSASTVTQRSSAVTVTQPTSTTKNGSEKSSYSSSIVIAAFQVVFLLFVNGQQTS
ncbi:hypothetical protein NDU88_000845 [Pleurodeles waltl]|uniref:Placenta-expressed transcript 1 protein n=1 Tax=Pleurodeles waltl TaxID=8319 RepID=A0AAV7TGM1_PLEWA|nr:hypothetical protein NDU88_000845 [Pleurodeles waltl]